MAEGPTAEELKAEGNASLAAGDAASAIASFTRAIALDATNHVYHSNRSAAHLQAGDAAAALADAERVVQLRPDWPRGYSRKGAALWKTGDLGGAVAAFEQGLAHDGANTALKENLAKAKTELAARSRPKFSGSSASGGGAPATNLRGLLFGSRGAAVHTVLFAARVFLLLCCCMYFSPLATGAAAAAAWRRAFLTSLGVHVTWVGWSCGRPTLSQHYAMAVLQEPAAQALLYDLVWVFCGPFAPALLPMVLVEALHAAKWAATAAGVAGCAGIMAALGAPLTGLLLPSLLCEPGFSALAPAARWALLFRGLTMWRAHAEVGVGLALLVHMIFPFRNLIAVVVFFQYLRMIYMLPAGVPQGPALRGISPDSAIKRSFTALDGRVAAVLEHVYMPSFVGAGYRKFKGGLRWLTKLPARPEPGATAPAPGGLASRCIIM